MLIVTRGMAFARDVADAVCFLHDGRILEQGPPRPGAGITPSAPRPSSSCAGC